MPPATMREVGSTNTALSLSLSHFGGRIIHDIDIITFQGIEAPNTLYHLENQDTGLNYDDTRLLTIILNYFECTMLAFMLS